MPKQISTAHNWTVTWHVRPCESLEYVFGLLKEHAARYCFQYEKAPTTGSLHLQGCVSFKQRVRPLSRVPHHRMNWEKSRGTWQQNLAYCTKDDTRLDFPRHILGCQPPVPLKLIKELRPWQATLVKKVTEEEPSDRSILWYWEPKGNVGKSALVKYLCAKHDAMLLSGSGKDVLNGLCTHVKEGGAHPRIVVYDIPRCQDMQFLSYASLEAIKNGHFYSGKYEGGWVLMNPPHLVVFSNEEPHREKMSDDRWVVTEIK